MKNIEVKSMTFGNGATRIVSIENPADNVDDLLDQVYHFGQNDFQPRNVPSVSVGDLITLDTGKYVVLNFGFEEIDFETYSKLIEIRNEANREKDHGAYFRLIFQKLGKESAIKFAM